MSFEDSSLSHIIYTFLSNDLYRHIIIRNFTFSSVYLLLIPLKFLQFEQNALHFFVTSVKSKAHGAMAWLIGKSGAGAPSLIQILY